MDTSVALVQTYLHVNGYFTVAEYPVLETFRGEHARAVTDLDILAFHRIFSIRRRRRERSCATKCPSAAGATSYRRLARIGGRRTADPRPVNRGALYDASRARRRRTEERTIDTVAIRTEVVASDALALRDASGRHAALTNWSFEQLAGIAAAPPKYLRTLPAIIAGDDFARLLAQLAEPYCTMVSLIAAQDSASESCWHCAGEH